MLLSSETHFYDYAGRNDLIADLVVPIVTIIKHFCIDAKFDLFHINEYILQIRHRR